MENEKGIFLNATEIVLDDHGSVKPVTGLMYEQILLDDPDTKMSVAKIRYPKGFMVPEHTHHCAHGYYVLKGTLVTSEGDFEPGSFVWFKEGTVMYHGAKEEDVEALAFANKAFDLTFTQEQEK